MLDELGFSPSLFFFTLGIHLNYIELAALIRHDDRPQLAS